MRLGVRRLLSQRAPRRRLRAIELPGLGLHDREQVEVCRVAPVELVRALGVRKRPVGLAALQRERREQAPGQVLARVQPHDLGEGALRLVASPGREEGLGLADERGILLRNGARHGSSRCKRASRDGPARAQGRTASPRAASLPSAVSVRRGPALVGSSWTTRMS